MLEIRTILVLMSIGSLLMVFILWSAFAGRLRDGLDKWALALVMQSFVWAGYASHGLAPALVSETLADSLLAISWTLKLISLLEFQHRPVPQRLFWGGTPLSIALLLTLSMTGLGRELLLFRGCLFAAATIGIAWLAWRIPNFPENRIRLVMVAIYIAVACGFLMRMIAVLWIPAAIPAPLDGSGFQTVTFLFGYAFIIMSSFCMLLLHKNRADNKNYLLSITDPLTGVYNRRSFMELADQLLARSARSNSSSALLMIDIDHFKRINDQHGHSTGDEALKAFVARIQPCLRDEDILVRFGGEEFCVLMPGADGEGALTLAERIREHVAAEPIEAEGTSIAVTVSIGIATAVKGGDFARESLFASADRALYEAKDAGRNQTILAAM
jgi:diguanylate cyclase (GGDEF)-like protein